MNYILILKVFEANDNTRDEEFLIKLILLAWTSVNRVLFPMWYRRSPPGIRSITRYNTSRSWKAYCIFTIKGLLILESRFFSLMTLWILFFAMTLNKRYITGTWAFIWVQKTAYFFCFRLSILFRNHLYRWCSDTESYSCWGVGLAISRLRCALLGNYRFGEKCLVCWDKQIPCYSEHARNPSRCLCSRLWLYFFPWIFLSGCTYQWGFRYWGRLICRWWRASYQSKCYCC